MHLHTKTMRRAVGAALIAMVSIVGAVGAHQASADSTECEYSEGLAVDTYDGNGYAGVCVAGVGSVEFVSDETVVGNIVGATVDTDPGTEASVHYFDLNGVHIAQVAAVLPGVKTRVQAIQFGPLVGVAADCPQGGSLAIATLPPAASLC